ncbi:hypothetical protein Tco_0109974 [Tanacetum coccineum]
MLGPVKIFLTVEAAKNILPVAAHEEVETIHNMTAENKLYFQAEKEAIFLILTGMDNSMESYLLTEENTRLIHKLFDVLKQFQMKYDIRSERLARSANPLALLAAAQPYSDNYYQAPKPQRSNAPSYKQSSSTRPSASTRHKGKEIAKPVTPQSESVSEEDSDPEQARRDKDMQKNLALLAKYFKKLYKPTNNNLRTSSNSRNKTEDTTPRCSKTKLDTVLNCKDLDTMPGNAGSQSGLKTTRITRRRDDVQTS